MPVKVPSVLAKPGLPKSDESEGPLKGNGMLALLALSGLMEGIEASRQKNKDREAATAAQNKDIAARAALQNQDVASAESMANPFRQQASQAATIGALDRQERGTYTPAKLASSNKYAGYVPQMSGGYSYEKSPELRASAGALKTDVMAGHTAPTMTNPANYGKTAALSLDANGNPVAAAPAWHSLADEGVDNFMSYDRRNAGGGGLGAAASYGMSGASTGMALGGPMGAAIGGGAGALIGLFGGGRHADTAKSDFAVEDARDAITKAIQYYQGRAATPQEVDQILAGQGWKPGSRWVGEAGLRSVLTSLAQQQG